MKKLKNHLGAALSVLLLFFTICFVIGVICWEQRKLSDRKPQQSQEASWESSNAETGVTEDSETESQESPNGESSDLETENSESESQSGENQQAEEPETADRSLERCV